MFTSSHFRVCVVSECRAKGNRHLGSHLVRSRKPLVSPSNDEFHVSCRCVNKNSETEAVSVMRCIGEVLFLVNTNAAIMRSVIAPHNGRIGNKPIRASS